jgi:hypothetical protein
MTDLRDAARQALNSLRGYRREIGCEQPCDAERALEVALAEEALQRLTDVHQEIEAALEQPQRTLTDEVIADLWHANGGFHHHFARAVERYLKGEK